MNNQNDATNREAHWGKTRSLMITMLVLWFVFSFLLHVPAIAFNEITIPVLNFKFSYYLAAQGSLVAFVIMIFVFAKKQNAIDEEFGFSEEDD